MKIYDFKIKLKNVRIEPLPSRKEVKSIDDVMYLYYTLQITQDKKTIEFRAYDFPVLQNIREIVDLESEDLNWMGKEHSIRVFKTKDLYTIHIFNHFGESCMLDLITKEEVYKFVDYIERKLEEAFESYNNGTMYVEK